MDEQWERIAEAVKYAVSSEGRVKNLKTGRILKINMIGKTPTVTLMDGGWRLTRSVSKLMKEAFGP